MVRSRGQGTGNRERSAVKVKICGITNLDDALACVESGADAIGFIFYRKSPRYISPKRAKEIIRQIPASVKKAGIFVNVSQRRLKHIAKELNLDMLQFHGDETAKFCGKFKGYKIIKSFRVRDKGSLKGIEKYAVWACLFDTYQKNAFGGTGEKFDWKLLQGMLPRCKNIFLSGGLSAKNLQQAIRLVCPNWVDVSSAVELSPGKKDHKKVREFISVAKKGQ